MNAIAKELYTRNRSSEFLEAVATKANTSTSKRNLKTPKQLDAVLEAVKKLEKYGFNVNFSSCHLFVDRAKIKCEPDQKSLICGPDLC